MPGPRIAVAWPKEPYLAALERAGGNARVLDPTHDTVPAVLDACDGLLLTGGSDVEPSRYGDTTRFANVETEPARDAYELDLVRGALERDLPVLAICRGIQLLNVAAGGTLIQDIPSERPSDVRHKVREPKDSKIHDVRLVPGSRLARVFETTPGGMTFPVNSRHHQAVKDVAPGFVVSATAPDGIIEGIERPGATFCLGVQWHPEDFWRTGEFSEIFTAFVDAARARASSRPA